MQTYKDHIPVLDSLRGLAAALVVFTHVPHAVLGDNYRLLQGILRPGYVAIEIFFVLSGFLITRILLSDRESGRPLKHFLARRFLRIFPIYYIFLAVMLIWHSWEEIRWCVLYVSNFVYPFYNPDSHLRHTWSLCVEEHYYLLWAFAVYGLSLKWSRRIAHWVFPGIAILGALWTVNYLESREAKRFLYMGSQYRMITLALGSALAFAEHSIRNKPKRWFSLAVVMFVVGEILVQLFVVGHIARWVGLPKYLSWNWVWVVRLGAFPLIAGSIVLSCVVCASAGWFRGFRLPAKGSSPGEEPTPWIRGLLGPVALVIQIPVTIADNVLQFVGRISYSWYLFHVPLFAAVFQWKGENVTALALAAGLSIATATVSFYAIERPILKLKSRFA